MLKRRSGCHKGFPPQLVSEKLFDNSIAGIVYETAEKYGVDVQDLTVEISL